jgi:hypothetical protein
MSVTSVSRWSGGYSDAAVARVKNARSILTKLGAESVRLSQIHTGPHAGQWLTSVSYPDWATLGKAQQALASDATYQKILADAGAAGPLVDRTIIVSIDL